VSIKKEMEMLMLADESANEEKLLLHLLMC
jgi:hypothetical protein